jgi:hypothetical protein
MMMMMTMMIKTTTTVRKYKNYVSDTDKTKSFSQSKHMTLSPKKGARSQDGLTVGNNMSLILPAT